MNFGDTLNKLAKWRSVFAGWQLGTRLDTDAECRAVKDHREATIMLRTEVTAITGLLLKKGIVTVEELNAEVKAEAEILDKSYEKRFPGITTSLAGVHFDLQKIEEHGTMKGWKP